MPMKSRRKKSPRPRGKWCVPKNGFTVVTRPEIVHEDAVRRMEYLNGITEQTGSVELESLSKMTPEILREVSYEEMGSGEDPDDIFESILTGFKS